MKHRCNKCGRYGMEWDARAKVLICHFHNCNYVIREVDYDADTPTEIEIKAAIFRDLVKEV